MGIMDILKDPAKTPTEKLDAVEDSTKAEIYEAAQELEVEGRSSMDKEELVEAVVEETVRDVVPTEDEVAKNRDRVNLRAKR